MVRVIAFVALSFIAISFIGVVDVATVFAQDQSVQDQSVQDQTGDEGAMEGRGSGLGVRRGPGAGRGFGRGFGRGLGRAFGQQQQGAATHGHDDRHGADHEVFQFLLSNHDKIRRSVKELPNGVETLTESDSPEVADKIREHVEWMAYRISNSNPIRMRDPLFAEIFKHTDKIEIVHEDTTNGVRVTETSEDAYVVKLIQAHAKTVSGFVEHGFDEAMKNHAVPDKEESAVAVVSRPKIVGHGDVVQLSNAVQQPRSGTKILVDLTRGGEATGLNEGIEKVAKYVNIYGGAGAEPADVQIAVIFHGDATLAVLNPDAYAKKFSTVGNPNLDLLRRLHECGVELYVCGQSLISKGAKPSEVAVFVETSVSAITTVANLQADGYAYVPLGN
ncbi:DsrE/DsrF-like family protein [Rubripirellula amarantea]|uniref:DsrE/DsrF-like family protein n=1 Tax=Rubripirellula amarantea TaxID=2527999 RepID=A0A5C5WEA1_9BACT|nr:DsrE family protein [Rubripirellula amarantea]TWT49306.1 DsrE/DsrF-like family protein [Rubripirellula amarantea]